MSSKKKPSRVTVGGWMGTLLISAIPVVNIVMWFVWAFTAKKPSRRTFAIAALILLAIFAALCAAAIAIWGQEILDWARQISPTLFTDTFINQ